MKEKRICVDLTNLVPGKGGTGGGITTYGINLINNLDINYTGNQKNIYCIKNSEFEGLEDLKNIMVVSRYVNNSNIISRLFWLHFRLPIFCISNKISVLHRIVPELPLLKVCRYIITMHDFMFDFYLTNPSLKNYLTGSEVLKFRLFSFFSKMAVKSANGIVVPAETIKEELEKRYNVRNKKIASIYEAAQTVSESEENTTDAILKIGVVAGFFPHKGHLNVIRLATAFCSAGYDDFRMFMRGSQVYPNYVAEIKDEIERHGLQEHIIFESFQKKVTLKEIYSKFDLVLLLSEYEGFGLPVLEAQAMSVPVICSDIPIFREILQDSAFFLNPDFRKSEVSELLNNIRDHSKRMQMAAKGKLNIQRFSWNRMASETMKLYQTICFNHH